MTKLLNDYSYYETLPIDLALLLIKETFSKRGVKDLKTEYVDRDEGRFSFVTDIGLLVGGVVDAMGVRANGYAEEENGNLVLVWDCAIDASKEDIEEFLTLSDSYESMDEALEYIKNPELANRL